jgi:methylmalonyl-CoA mutase C-terminal domain/subunit
MIAPSEIRILIAKVGLDGHDRGAIVVAKALQHCGFMTFYSGIRQSPEDIAALALLHEVDCVGLSSLAGAHLTLFPRVTEALQSAAWSGRLVIAGGIIPSADEPALLAAGIQAVFHPHQSVTDAAHYIRHTLTPIEVGMKGRNEVV